MTAAELSLVGYTDRLSVQPGERIEVMVSCASDRYGAGLVRLGSEGDETRFPAAFTGSYEGQVQPLRTGSYMEAIDARALSLDDGLALSAWIWPTTPAGGRQGIVALHDAAGFRASLAIVEGGRVALSLRDNGGSDQRVVSPTVVSAGRWWLVAGSVDTASRCAHVWVCPCATGSEAAGGSLRCRTRSLTAPRYLVAADAAPGGGVEAHFNGKIEAPAIYGRRLEAADAARLAGDAAPAEIPGVRAAWDFAVGMSTRRTAEVSGARLDGRLVNMPTRAVTGRRFTGKEVDWRRAPEHYGAIHFHEDDLDDAEWPPAFSWQVPDELESGVYAILLEGADRARDRVPFVVRPRRGDARSDVAFLAPTFTYLAYANEHQLAGGSTRRLFEALGADFRYPAQATDRYILEHRLASCYDRHADGSGVCYSSSRRPLVTMRPGYRFPYLRDGAGGPHGLPADLDVLAWLERRGVTVDVVTDHDLHQEGSDLLRRYRVVLSGSHHEYWSAEMLDGLSYYLERGGRFMYLSGNGLYWVTGLDPERGHTIEVRRWGGTRTWDASPGEWHLSTTGELGGIWRARGMAPQRFVGVGFTAEGLGPGRPYRRTEASFDPRAAFIFDGIGADEPIGDCESAVLGAGAAGWEIDRFDVELGSPPHALVVATADGFSDGYQHVVEEVLHQDSRQGGTRHPDVRADMVFFETPSGGAVFSVGSIGWCGCLLAEGGDNTVARVTGNVLDRFRDPARFVPEPTAQWR